MYNKNIIFASRAYESENMKNKAGETRKNRNKVKYIICVVAYSYRQCVRAAQMPIFRIYIRIYLIRSDDCESRFEMCFCSVLLPFCLALAFVGRSKNVHCVGIRLFSALPSIRQADGTVSSHGWWEKKWANLIFLSPFLCVCLWNKYFLIFFECSKSVAGGLFESLCSREFSARFFLLICRCGLCDFYTSEVSMVTLLSVIIVLCFFQLIFALFLDFRCSISVTKNIFDNISEARYLKHHSAYYEIVKRMKLKWACESMRRKYGMKYVFFVVVGCAG